ncbi:F-actin-monooxygenase mical2b isoform X1 [Paramormyrops kingsleyae]|uniref:F-actin-monooxygenase mical2b isoform X1 n=1 Tax=Paramormyrops kingsleyae TaxID=1676925 RepID=UPI003B96FE68
MGETEDEKCSQAGQLFENFVQASTCKGTLQAFGILCRQLELDPLDHKNFYSRLKAKVTFWKAKGLWSKLDKRAGQKDYKKGKSCVGTKCLIIGGGPCGLRTAIELALLGAKVVVIEKRDTFSRNNVLHLWPYTIHDLRGLGAKKFYGKFCAGSIDHISIRQLQLMLLKVSLILAVEVHVNVEFVKLLEPPEDQENEGPGWRAEICPSDHPVSDFDFDVVVGADGRRNTLEGFRRKEFRGKLAIAITANFINRNTTAEAKVEEISGVAFIFNQKFFLELKEETGIDLENIVYYKDNTHYFVMTAKKQSLLDKGVIVHDYADTEMLLSAENVQQEALLSYAREAADFATDYQLPSLDFAMNHNGQPDVAMFDFTCMYASENAALVRERFGHRLLVALVGDSLLEPFWPMGTGCARGFLAAFDTAWMTKSWAQGRPPLEILAERESLYRLLPQTTPENITKNFEQYTIDPVTRYPNLNSNCVRPHQVRHLYITGELQPESLERAASFRRPVNLGRRESEIRPSRLLTWCQRHTEGYRNVCVSDLTSSWKSGLALCALIHNFRADLIDFDSLNEEESAKNNQMAFDIAEREFGIPPVTTGKEMASDRDPDKLNMVLYLSKFYEMFRGDPIPASGFKRETDQNEDYSGKIANSISNLKNLSLPRKRIPKGEQKSDDKDTISKRRRKYSNYLEEATNFPSQTANSVGEDTNLKENKVKFMATKLQAKFEENAPSCSLRRQTESDLATAKPPRPRSLDLVENPRFARPKDQAPPPPSSKRQLAPLAKCALECGTSPPPSPPPYIPREPRQTRSRPEAGNSAHVDYPESPASCHSAVLVVSGMLRRLRCLEDHISEKRAQTQKAREFQKKSIKEKAVHLSSLFSDPIQTHSPAARPKPSTSQPPPESSALCYSSPALVPSPPGQRQQLQKCLKLVSLRTSRLQSRAGPCPLVPLTALSSLSLPVSALPCQRTVGKVSLVIGAMAETLATLYETDHRPHAMRLPAPLGSLRREFPPSLGGSDTCHFCQKRVYVMERLSAEGLFFHRECFRCDTCSTTLRLGGQAFDSDQGKFYCKLHFAQQKALIKHRRRTVELQKGDQEVGAQGGSVTTAPDGKVPHSADSVPESQPAESCLQPLETQAGIETHSGTLQTAWSAPSATTEIVQTRVTEVTPRASDPEGSDGPDITHSSPLGIQRRSPWPAAGGLGASHALPGVKVTAGDCGKTADPSMDHWGQGQVSPGSPITPPGSPSLFLFENPLHSPGPSSPECQPTSVTPKCPKPIEGQPDEQLPSSGKKKLTISQLEREKLLQWDLDSPDEPETQDTAESARIFGRPSDQKANCEISITPPVTIPTSAPAQSHPPQSPFQLVANTLMRSFGHGSPSSTSSATRRSSSQNSRPPSEGSFKLSSLLWGKTGWDHNSNSKGGGQNVLPGPSLNPTAIPKTSSVLELPNLLENVSLGEESGRISKDDMAIVSHKNLNFFSSLRVKKTDSMTKRVTEGQENDIWSMVSNLRKKVSSQEQRGSSSSSEDESAVSSPKKDSPSLKQKRRQERTMLQKARQEQLKRLHRAQVIQRQLEEAEEKQRALEENGVTLEKMLRGEMDGCPCDEAELLQTWYRLVLEKNRLGNYESELMIFAQELELEDTQSQLQQKLWHSMAIEDSRKSPQELSEEQQMFAEMMRVVEKRDTLVALLEEKRISESTDGRDLESIVHQFHWT